MCSVLRVDCGGEAANGYTASFAVLPAYMYCSIDGCMTSVVPKMQLISMSEVARAGTVIVSSNIYLHVLIGLTQPSIPSG